MDKHFSKDNAQSAKQQKRDLGRKVDLVSTILEDHKPLKELIEIMKDLETPFDDRKESFMEFAPLLLTHAKAEEKSLYKFLMHSAKSELKTEGFEGQEEHNLADLLTEEIKRTTDPDAMSARIKVIAELVEHHIQEEESEMLPKVQRAVDESDLFKLNDEYLRFMEELIAEGQDDAPSEKELPH